MKLTSQEKFDRQLDTIRIGRNICFGGGSAPAPAPSSTTVTQTNLPAYLQPYVERNVQQAEAATNTPYQTYGGQRTAGFNPTQTTAQGTITGMQNQDPTFNAAQGATQGVMNKSWTDPGVAAQFMNPYQQNVTDIAKREAQRQSDIQGVGTDAQFAKAGAFGGSRQGVVDAERMRNLSQQQNDIQMQGANQAYQQGANQFNNQNQTQLAAGAQSATMAGQQQGADLGLSQAQLGVGQQQQALTQQQQDVAYQDFLNQRDYSKQQANYMAGIIHGTPVTAQSNVTGYQAPPNMTGQIAGLGIAGLGAYNAATKG